MSILGFSGFGSKAGGKGSDNKEFGHAKTIGSVFRGLFGRRPTAQESALISRLSTSPNSGAVPVEEDEEG
jgi:hypothetical protein